MKVISLGSRLLFAATKIACGCRACSQSTQESFLGARVHPPVLEKCGSCRGETSASGMRVGSEAGLLEAGARDPGTASGDPAARLFVQT